ncbi:hypothetical protein [Actinomycetospora straminea]|uniref:DivIVA domain-containing protein n=1 Tax=Actinomycetospora straminea TaxID=663607 RepID=A0ABP9EKV7_9PSEU|nr:hypothetical protein [Actinomycetospora straminea]MDD7935076.1 hypothetical protein [Actinomycetospora straminea]
MASRLARLFGRRNEDRTAETSPPAYTGVGAPREYAPPSGAPGHGTAPYGPTPVRTPYEEAVRRRRAADHHVAEYERFDARLSAQIHEAQQAERTDYVRELLSRQQSVRARLEEATLLRNRLLAAEQEHQRQR